jgi:hypothetical protein
MRKSGLLFSALILIAPLLAVAPSKANAGAWLSMLVKGDQADTSSSLVVKVKKKKKKHDEGNNTTQGERSCPPGYVVLDKPNKYGAYCELAPKEPPAPKELPVEWTEFVREIWGTNITPEALSVPFKNECAYYKKSYTNCEIITASPNTHIRCACHYQK